MVKQSKPKFELGQKVRDVISGYDGIVTAITQWYNGCVRYRLEPDHLNEKGELIEDQTFDEEQLEEVKVPKIKVPTEPTGGGRIDPVKPRISR